MIIEKIIQDYENDISYIYCAHNPHIIMTRIPQYMLGHAITDDVGIDQLYHIHEEDDDDYAKQIDDFFAEVHHHFSLKQIDDLIAYAKHKSVHLYKAWLHNPYFLATLTYADGSQIIHIEELVSVVIPTTFAGKKAEVQEILTYVIQKQKDHTGSLCFSLSHIHFLYNKFMQRHFAPEKQLSFEDFVAYINYFKHQFYLTETTITDSTLIALKEDYDAEERIFLNIYQKRHQPTPFPNYQPEPKEGLADEQNDAVMHLLQYDGIAAILSGGPGTGKTTILREIVLQMKTFYPDEKIALLSPTGKAAKRIQEVMGDLPLHISTVHRFLGLTVDTTSIFKQEQIDFIRNHHLILIDESSMLSISIFSILLKYIDLSRTKILLIGDIHQLPSIEAGSLLRDLITIGTPMIMLQSNFRSIGSIVDNSKKINAGDIDLDYNESFQLVNSNIYDQLETITEDPDAIILSAYRTETNPTSTTNLNEAIHKRHLQYTDYRVKFLPDEMVIATRTEYKNKKMAYANGDVGVVLSVYMEDDGTYVYEVLMGDNRVQIPEIDLDYAYALTIHKSQGSEYPTVHLIMDKYSPFISRKMLYTAITRAKEKVIIYSTPEIMEKVIANNADDNRQTLLSLKAL